MLKPLGNHLFLNLNEGKSLRAAILMAAKMKGVKVDSGIVKTT